MMTYHKRDFIDLPLSTRHDHRMHTHTHPQTCTGHKPVEVPDDAGSVSADADQDTVWFADKKTCDLICVSIQVNLRLNFHLRALEKKETARTWYKIAKKIPYKVIYNVLLRSLINTK